jgi:endonuclease G
VISLARLSSLLFTLIASVAAQPQRFGAPACSGPDRELADRFFFVLCHNSALKVPIWVGYELEPRHLIRLAPRPHGFRRDGELSHPGAADADYKHSGFSRGHMAPAADFAWSEAAMRATFLLSNVVPQKQKVNAGLWARLEAVVRRVAADCDGTYVFTGPLFDGGDAPQAIGAGRIAVPSHLFKVVLAIKGGRRSMLAAIIPNAESVSGVLDDYAATVDEVERRTGLDFFAALPDAEEQELESTSQPLSAGGEFNL